MPYRSLRLFAALLGLALAACSPRPPSAPAAETPALVKTHLITAAAAPARDFPASLSAHRSADLAFEVGGVVREILADTGARVTTGQALAVLDDRDYQSRLLAARAEAERTRSDQLRADSLLAQNAIAPAKVEALRAAADAALAVLDQADKAVNDTTLRAPFDGVVAAKFIERFASVQAKAPAFRVHDLSAFTVAIDLPQSIVLASQRRRAAGADTDSATFAARFADPGAAPEGYPLTISSFSTDPDPRTGTYRFELRLPAPEGLTLLPGMSCTVRITLPAPENGRVLVPHSAIGTDASGAPRAWVIDAQGLAQPRPVVLGPLTAEGLVISSGLAPGETVITAGLAQLRPGLAVRPL